VLKAWLDLAKRGVDKRFAFYLAHTCREKDGKIAFDQPLDWHCSINGRWSKSYLKNFLTGTFTNVNNKFNVGGRYSGYSDDLFEPEPKHEGDGESFCYEVSRRLVNLVVATPDYNNNPFAAKCTVRRGAGSVDREKALDLLSSISNELIEEVMNA